jgi:hypothetical protein
MLVLLEVRFYLVDVILEGGTDGTSIKKTAGKLVALLPLHRRKKPGFFSAR